MLIKSIVTKLLFCFLEDLCLENWFYKAIVSQHQHSFSFSWKELVLKESQQERKAHYMRMNKATLAFKSDIGGLVTMIHGR